MTTGEDRPRRIWDVPTRLFHWLLAASVTASWATAELSDTLMGWHLVLGYFTVGLIIFRLLWGLVGARHARFASFLMGPRTVIGYARSIFGGADHVEAPGHNPMGGWMVALLLLLLVFQVSTGLFSNDEIAYSGPWAHTVDGHWVKMATRLHKLNVNLILAAVALHLAAVLAYQWGRKTDLIGPMITGRKAASRVSPEVAIPGTPWLRFVVVAMIAGAAAWAIVKLAPPKPPGAYHSFN